MAASTFIKHRTPSYHAAWDSAGPVLAENLHRQSVKALVGILKKGEPIELLS
jgi:hypothetical protein